ncbi:MAG TPA: TonB-dependent receptor, partial [Sphingobacteriaceae bacterium]
SIHLLGGMDKKFRWTRPLKLTSELYYKALSHLVPYKIDNLRIQYLPGQSSRGYAAGADLNLSGEFVKDLESSFRLSLMKTAEDIDGDFLMKRDPSGNLHRVEPGYLKRPTDQRLNFSVFFQDKLFRSPEYKVHLNLLYGSALPIGPPQRERYEDIFAIPAYKRADIGFSKDLISQRGSTGPKSRYFKSLTIYAGVFNLLGNRNTISYLWLTDINNNQYAIPNHLTGRSLNLRLIGRIN